jgi:proteasome activator subunit 4
MGIRSGHFDSQLKQIMEQLPKWKAERPHGPKAVQSEHDNAAMTSELSRAIFGRGKIS